jgi:hypothetical protein
MSRICKHSVNQDHVREGEQADGDESVQDPMGQKQARTDPEPKDDDTGEGDNRHRNAFFDDIPQGGKFQEGLEFAEVSGAVP